MGAERLQGTPWHPDQLRKTCKEGSKFCLYNSNNNCLCVSSIFYHTECVGKGNCEEFESKGNMAKTAPKKTIIIKQNPQNSKQPTKEMLARPPLIIKHYKKPVDSQSNKDNKGENTMHENDENEVKVKETPEEKFLRLSQSRVNSVDGRPRFPRHVIG